MKTWSKLSCLLMITSATGALAHDFWIQPGRFRTRPDAVIPVTLQIGHGSARERWPGAADRIVKLIVAGPDGTRNLKPAFRRDAAQIDLLHRFDRPGVHAFVMQTSPARSELPARRFTDYARDEGLTSILAHRERNRTTARPGRELYSRRAKAIVKVGETKSGGTSIATHNFGLTLEIVPERDPYALTTDRVLPLHVVFEGRRLPGALVKLTDLANDEKPAATAVTDRHGRAAFRIPSTGRWLVNVVWSKPIVGHRWAEYDTTFSSLTFGYD